MNELKKNNNRIESTIEFVKRKGRFPFGKYHAIVFGIILLFWLALFCSTFGEISTSKNFDIFNWYLRVCLILILGYIFYSISDVINKHKFFKLVLDKNLSKLLLSKIKLFEANCDKFFVHPSNHAFCFRWKEFVKYKKYDTQDEFEIDFYEIDFYIIISEEILLYNFHRTDERVITKKTEKMIWFEDELNSIQKN